MRSFRAALGMTMVGAMALGVWMPASAQLSYSGTIEVIEVWKQGNVAFKLSGVTGTCATNNWMVINKSAPGHKNLYAALLASKMASKPIRISSSGCAPAEEYNSTPYMHIDYLFMVD